MDEACVHPAATGQGAGKQAVRRTTTRKPMAHPYLKGRWWDSQDLSALASHNWTAPASIGGGTGRP